MRPSPKYRRAVSRNGIHVSPTHIPPHLQAHVEDGLATGVRKGKARQKIGMWGTLSPYYRNAITIDSRWSQTVTNKGV